MFRSTLSLLSPAGWWSKERGQRDLGINLPGRFPSCLQWQYHSNHTIFGFWLPKSLLAKQLPWLHKQVANQGSVTEQKRIPSARHVSSYLFCRWTLACLRGLHSAVPETWPQDWTLVLFSKLFTKNCQPQPEVRCPMGMIYWRHGAVLITSEVWKQCDNNTLFLPESISISECVVVLKRLQP